MKILKKLNLQTKNAGACTGAGKWMDGEKKRVLTCVNPSTAKQIANIYCCVLLSNFTFANIVKFVISSREASLPKLIPSVADGKDAPLPNLPSDLVVAPPTATPLFTPFSSITSPANPP